MDINSIEFADFNLKYVKDRWFPTTIYNFEQNLKRFYNLVIELFCLNTEYFSIYKNNPKLDVTITINNKKVTPDMVDYDTLGNVSRIVEFKCSMHEIDAVRRQELKEEAISKYGKLVEMVYLTADHKFMQKIADPRLRNLYLIILNDIYTAKKNLPKDKILQYFKSESIMPSIPELLKDHPKVQSINDNELEHDDYLEVKEMIPQILNYMNKMEDYANENFLAAEDMPNYMPKIENPTVFLDHPWNRDLNREAYSKTGKSMNWGHKASILYQLPPNKLVEPCTLKEIKEVIYSLAPTTGLADTIANTIDVMELCKDNLDKIKELINIKAYVKTEADSKEITRIANLYNAHTNKLEEILSDYINLEIEKIKRKINKDIKLSKHGLPLLKLDDDTKNKLGIYKSSKNYETLLDLAKVAEKLNNNNDVNQENPFINTNIKERNKPNKNISDKKEGVTVLEAGDWFNYIKTKPDYVPLLNYFKPRKDLKSHDFTNAYTFNDMLNKLNNEMVQWSDKELNHILQSSAFSSVYSYVQFYRAIVAAVPRIESKGKFMEEGIITKHPDGYYLFITPSPNEITSGTIVMFGKLNNSLKYPEWATPITTKTFTANSYYFMTKPIRINLKAATSADALLGSFLGSSILTRGTGADLLSDDLWTSLWWAFTRQQVLIADIVYMFYKNAYNIGTFGKNELAKKFKKLSIRDVRVATIYKRLKDNYTKFVYDFRSTINYSTWVGVKDPIFNFTHTGWQTFAHISYLKQVYPKDDGYDAANIMGGFFRDEMEYQGWYFDSPFKAASLNYHKSMPIKTFFDLLFIDNKSWANLAYHPDMCYRMVEKVTKATLTKHPDANPYRDWNKAALKTARSSKCNIPEEQSKLYGVKEMYEKTASKKAKYKGVVSSNLAEALALESKLFKRHVEEKFLMSNESAWSKMDYKLGDRLPSMIELALFEAYVYPECVVLTMVDKVQTGYDKRAFFVQLVFNRNANKIWDETFRPIVITNETDMILTPGMEKYIKFGVDMKKIGNQRGHLMVSKDATKFGDTYLVESFDVQIIALVGSGYLSNDEGKMLLYFSKCLKNRIVLMPWQNSKLIDKAENKDYLTDNQRKWVLEMDKFTNYLNDPSRFEGFINDTVMNNLKENRCFRKNVGFTLGVFNIAGSLYTLCAEELIEEIETFLGIHKIFKAATHSDDSHNVLNIKPPTKDDFKIGNRQCTDLVNYLLTNQKTIYYNAGIFTVSGTSFAETIQIPETTISKLHLLLTLFAPRFFSQRPSLLKWGFGYANEVLQVTQFDGKVFVPLIRYSAALGKDLPGKSPASDTYMMCGRYYDLLVNGCYHDIVCTTIMACNWMISDMYGMKDYERDINDPPELGGLWWALPGLIYEQGFNANEVRLQAYQDQLINRKLAFMVNAETVWKKEKKNNDLKNLFVMESLGLDDEEPMIEGGIEYRKDFQIKINRKKKSSLGMFKLLDAFTTEIKEGYRKAKAQTKSFLNEEEDLEVKTMMERLKDQWQIETLVGNQSAIQNYVSMISKYTTTAIQNNYVRVSPDVKLVSRMGYMKRKFPNPFVESIQNFLFQQINLDITAVTPVEIWNAIKYLAKGNYQLDPINLKGILLTRKILTTFIADTRNIIIPEKFIEETVISEEMKVEYIKIKDKRELVGVGSYSIQALAAVYQIDSSKNMIPLRETFVVKSNPDLMDNKYFAEQVQVVRNFVKGLGFGIADIFKHFKLLSRLLNEKSFYGIAKLPAETFRFELTTGMFWRFNLRRIFNVSYKSNNNNFDTEDKSNDPNNNNNNNNKTLSLYSKEFDTEYSIPISNIRFDRIIATVSWAKLVFPNEFLKYGTIMKNSLAIKIPYPHKILDSLLHEEFSTFKANQLLASLIWYKQTEGYPFILVRNKLNKDAYALMIQIGGTPSIYLHGFKGTLSQSYWKKASTYDEDTLEELERREIWRWEIFANEFSSDITDNLGHYFYTIAKIATYWMMSRNKRLDKIIQLFADRKKITKFALFGNSISYEDSGNKDWTYLSIYNYVPKEYYEIKPVIGELQPYGILFTYKQIKKSTGNNIYIVTPWDLGSLPSGLEYVIDNKVLIHDSLTFLICKAHNWYITYFVPNINDENNFIISPHELKIHHELNDVQEYFAEINKLEENYKFAKIDINLALEICYQLAKISDWEEKAIMFKSEDFSEIVSYIREIELTLGCPLTLIYKNIINYDIKKNREKSSNKAFQLKAKQYLGYCVNKILLQESFPKRILRLIGFISMCLDDSIVDYPWILANFLITTPQDLQSEVNKWDIKNQFILENLDLDLELRWSRRGNLPISVFQIFLSSIPAMYKIASFFRRENRTMYSRLAVDEIYLVNAIECSGNSEVNKLIPYLGII